MHREERGRYLIEASAYRLIDGNKWQPRLTMPRSKHGRRRIAAAEGVAV